MSHEDEIHHVQYVSLPGARVIRAAAGESLTVTITRNKVQAADAVDLLLRDVGRPNWPHRADK